MEQAADQPLNPLQRDVRVGVGGMIWRWPSYSSTHPTAEQSEKHAGALLKLRREGKIGPHVAMNAT